MADLIDRQAAKEEILSWAVRITSPNNLSTADTMYVLDMLPAVNAVKVVRCGECLHRYTGLRPNCHGRRPDWFCADGIKRPGAERREENAAD